MTEFRIKTVRRAACAAGIAAVVAASGIGIGNAFAQPVQSSTDDATAEFIDRSRLWSAEEAQQRAGRG